MSERKTYPTGAKRDSEVAGSKETQFPARYDLISPLALKRIAETYGEGSLKYGDNNWRPGFPTSVMLNHALAHIVSYMTGDTSEDHLAHGTWNLITLMHLEQTHPELDDRHKEPTNE